jgi:hypothetical protein
MAFCILISGSSWLAFNVAILTSFGLLYSKVWHLQNFVLWWRIVISLRSLEGSSSKCSQWILDLVVNGEWLLWSLKPRLVGVFASTPFLLLSLQCDVQSPRYISFWMDKNIQEYIKSQIFSFAEIKLYYKLWLYLKTFKEILKSYYHVTFNPSIRKTNAWDLYI